MLAWAVYTSKFFPIHKSGELGFLKRLSCTTLVGNTVSKYRWGYKLLAIKAAPPAPKLNPLPLVSLQYETNRTCEAAKASLCLDSSHMYYHFPNNWLVQIFFISMIRLWSSNVLWFWATQIPKSDPKNECLCS